MRIGRAYSNMLRLAAENPGEAVGRLFSSLLNRNAWLLAGVYVVVVIVAGIIAQNMLMEAGYEPGFLFNLAFYAFMALLFLVLITPAVVMNFGNADSDTHGSARFSTAREVAALTLSGAGLLIGRDGKTGRVMRYDGPAHLLTMAPTRSGKGVGSIIPNLLTAERSVICIDPKGENAKVAGRARQGFGPVHILDPFGVTGQNSAAFNPLDALDIEGLDVAEDASTLADALVHDDPGSSSEAHWNEEAKALIAGVILYVTATEPRDRRTLAVLRDYLTLAPDAFAKLLTDMQDTRQAGGLIARAANRFLGKSDREAAGVLSTAQRHTHFLDSPRMGAVLGRSDFRFADLKKGTATVFLVLPPDRLSTYSRWLRLLITQSLLDMARDPAKPAVPVLYLLDEFAALGHLAAVERAMGLMAGYGVQLWPILQDLHQLRAIYGPKAGTFMSNAGVLQVFGVNDSETARFVSDMLGQETVVFQSMGRAVDAEETGISYSEQHVARPLLTPDEVRNAPEGTELLFITGKRPVIGQKLAYYADPEFKGLFDPT